MDRIERLGNAVVPQIPEIIGRAIMNYVSHSREIAVTDQILTADQTTPSTSHD
jgi:hypothetical protein